MIKINDILDCGNNLSPHQLSIIEFENKKNYQLRDLIDFQNLDKNKGVDVGSSNYLTSSPNVFLRTNILSSESFIPIYNKEDLQYINPHSFVQMNLKKGDIIITKDSNIGECAVLPNDMPNAMLCGAMYRLPIKKHALYIFAILKSDIFKNQLDLMVPRGATIRHAGKKFLDCKIPFPKNDEEIFKIESIVNKIIAIETQIIKNEQKIFEILDKEFSKTDTSKFDSPKVKLQDLIMSGRLDESFHDSKLKKMLFVIKNYPKGFKTIKGLGFKTKRGQNLQVSQIGTSIYYTKKRSNLYTLIKPTNFTDFGTVLKYQYFGNKLELSKLEPGNIIFSAEGTIGKCVLFNKTDSKYITNIHGVILYGQNDIKISSFICSILRYYKSIKLFDYISVGGQGGSLSPKVLEEIPIPNLPEKVIEDISNLYCSGNISDSDEEKNLNSLGICQLDEYKNLLKEQLKVKIEKIKNEN